MSIVDTCSFKGPRITFDPGGNLPRFTYNLLTAKAITVDMVSSLYIIFYYNNMVVTIIVLVIFTQHYKIKVTGLRYLYWGLIRKSMTYTIAEPYIFATLCTNRNIICLHC